jgi:HAD superfamily hydrolase (TIGR01662 family)
VRDTAAVFFDVDFTLIHPGPRFQGSGYQASCARHGIVVDPARFEGAVAAAAPVLDTTDHRYRADVFIRFTARVIELMGGESPAVETVARELYDDWAEHHHFELYDDVRETFARLRAAGVRIGLISNSHRCLESFQSHFALDGMVAVAISSAEVGIMKPHPNIFRTALTLMDVDAPRAVMVGDSLTHDVDGARQVGMRGVLLARKSPPAAAEPDVPIIASLRELPALLSR